MVHVVGMFYKFVSSYSFVVHSFVLRRFDIHYSIELNVDQQDIVPRERDEE